MSRKLLVVGWTLSMIAIFGIVFGQYRLQQFDYSPPSNLGDATYEALRRVTWSLSVAWLILASINGYGGIIDKFLSLPIWLPISKLSYTIYLIHLPLQLIELASVKTPQYFDDFQAIHKFWGDFGLTFLISWIWSLAFEYPILNLTTIFLKK
jgi:peptidoglycan/LPS O-acetylase OafA/YrhL